MAESFQNLAELFSAIINKNSDGYIDYVTIRGQGNAPAITIPSHHFLALKSGINIHDEETDNNDQHKVSNKLRYDPNFKTFLLHLSLYNSYIGLKHTSKKAADLISEVTKYVENIDGKKGGKRKKQKTKTNKRKRTKSKTNKRKKRTRRRR